MRIRHLSSTLAVAMITPVLVVMPVPAMSQSAEAGPVPTSEEKVALLDPAAAPVVSGSAVSDADQRLATQQATEAGARVTVGDEAEVLKVSPVRDLPSTLSVVGVTWEGNPGKGTVVQYRTRGTGNWEAWQGIDSDSSQSEAGSTRGGSDPLALTGATQIQVRVLGHAEESVIDPRLSIIDPGTSPADATAGTSAPGTAHAAAARPAINSRASWGANESWRKGTPSYASPKGVVIHHTAGTNSYTQAQVPAVLRGIYAFHTRDRGWSDVGYNFLVDRWGRVWEGRYGGTSRGVIAAHTLGYNQETMGISVMGDFQKTQVPEAAVRSVERVIAWKAGIHGFNPAGTTTLLGKRSPVVIGHRDVNQTTCPGNYFYGQMGRIRSGSAVLAGRSTPASSGGTTAPKPAPKPVTKPVTPATAINDVLMRGSSGALLRSTPNGTTGMSYATRLSAANWSGYDRVVAAGDLTGDGRSDIVARVARTGALQLFPGTATGLGPARAIGTGWGGMSHITAGGNVTGDRHGDLVALTSAGVLMVYAGNGKGGFGRGVAVTSGWAGRSIAGLGDWDGDGKGDLLSVHRGTGYVHRGNGRGGFLGTVRLHTSLAPYRTLAGLPGQKAVFGVDASGAGWMIRRHGTSTVRATKVAPNFSGLVVFGG